VERFRAEATRLLRYRGARSSTLRGLGDRIVVCECSGDNLPRFKLSELRIAERCPNKTFTGLGRKKITIGRLELAPSRGPEALAAPVVAMVVSRLAGWANSAVEFVLEFALVLLGCRFGRKRDA
jgi:hypothetical protein